MGIVAEDVPPDVIDAPFDLDFNQRRCVASWLSETIGVNQVTVAGGKTAMFAAAAALIKKTIPDARFLYFTQTERLVSQVTREMRKFLPGFEVSQYGGKHKDPDGKDMVVCTAAMLNRNYKDLIVKKWFKTFVAVFADESHHVASPTFERVLLSTPALFRFGASDSVKEDDIVKSTKIEGLVGPVLNKVEAAPLIDIGRIARPHIYLVDCPDWTNKFRDTQNIAPECSPAWVHTDGEWKRGTYMGPAYTPDEKSSDGIRRDKHGDPVYMPNRHRIVFDGDPAEYEIQSRWCLLDRLYDRAIIRFKSRNELIRDWTLHWASQGKPTLVVCTRTLHVLILESMIKEVWNPDIVHTLYSHHSTEERDRTIEKFKTTPGAILITPLVKEGVSINEIEAGVIADYVADWEVMNQIIGRFIRKKLDDKPNEAHITVFIDRQHPTYRRGSIKVFQRLEEIRGYSYYHPVIGPSSISQALHYTP